MVCPKRRPFVIASPCTGNMWACSGFHYPGDPRPLTHSPVSDKNALAVLIRNSFRKAIAGGRPTWLRTSLGVNKSWFVPCSPDGGDLRNRGYELAFQHIGVVRVTQHCPILGPVDAGDKDRVHVTVSSLVGKRYPRSVMVFRVLFEGAQPSCVLPVYRVFSQKDSAFSARELERNAGSGYRCAGV